MTAAIIILTGTAVALFLLFKRRNGAYPLFGGNTFVRVRLSGDRPRGSRLAGLLLPLRLRYLEEKVKLLSPFMPLGRTAVRLSGPPVRRGPFPRAAGWEVYSQSGLTRAFHAVNLSLAGIITAFLLIYSLVGFTVKKAHSRMSPPSADGGKPPAEKSEVLLVSLPGDCPPRLVASDCPVRFSAGARYKEDRKLIASLQNPTAHPFVKKGGTHINSPGSHSNTAGVPHVDVAATYSHFNAHTNNSHTNYPPCVHGTPHVNMDERDFKD